MWIDFAFSIDVDFTNYDEASPWPILFDEYVAWAKEKKKEEEMEIVES
jgi:hypothetical protein